MDKSTRSATMKEAAYRRSLAKISPHVVDRIQQEAAQAAVDRYEQGHKLGKYQPATVSNNTEERPVTNETVAHDLTRLDNQVTRLLNGTAIEARKQKYAMVQFHLEAAYRYLGKAARQ